MARRNPGRKKTRTLDRQQSIASWEVTDRAYDLAVARGQNTGMPELRRTHHQRRADAYQQVGRGRFGNLHALDAHGTRALDRAETRTLKSFAKRKAKAAHASPRKKRRGGPVENPARAIDHKFAGQLFSADRQLGIAYVRGTLSKTTARELAAAKNRKRR